MIGLGILIAMASSITLTIMARSKGVRALHVAIVAGIIFAVGFAFYTWGIQKTSDAQLAAQQLHRQAIWGVVLIISGLLSGVTLALIGIMRGLTRASKFKRRR